MRIRLFPSRDAKPDSKRKSIPFSFCLIIVSYLMVPASVGGESNFKWLKVGSYARYSFGTKIKPDFLGFDDCGVANFVTGNYSWTCIEVNGENARLKVEINFTVSGNVDYSAQEFVVMAKNNDLSFIKRIPTEQMVGNVELFPGMVIVRGPIYIHKDLVVTVDLNTMELIDENGNVWGKWVMWINPLKYPLEGKTRELFVKNWLNTTIELDVHYPNITISITTGIGTFNRFIAASRIDPIRNEFLLKLKVMSEPEMVMTYIYEPRSGILLKQLTQNYLDDILTQKMGIIFTNGEFVLSQTNITINQGSEPDFTPLIPYLAVLGISGIMIGAYLIKNKKHLLK